MTVLIPSAGLGSRLKSLTNFYNKSMIPIGNLPVISHIIDSYEAKTEFIIPIGYGGEHLKEYLSCYHSLNKIKFIQIKNYSGVGSGLNLTLSKCSKEIKSDFIFHVNDAILKEKISQNYTADTLIITNKYLDKKDFRKVSIKDNKINKIYDKSYNSQKTKLFTYVGIGYVKDYILFNDIIKNSNNNLAELNYFKQICKNNTLNYKLVREWYDTGTKNSLSDTIKKLSNFTNLNKLDEAIYFKSNKVIKFYTNKLLVKKRVYRAKILKNTVPKILSSSNFFYSYKYIKGDVFSNCEPTKSDFEKLLKFLEKNLWIVNTKISNRKFFNNCRKFYYDKTISRVKKFYSIYKISDQKNTINGKNYKKLKSIFKNVKWNHIFNGKPVLFHGDLHFENIIKTNKSFKLIDWRDSFDSNTSCGDIYYDFAKIYHGLIVKHSIVKDNNFDILINHKSEIKINIKKYKGYKNLTKLFLDYIQNSGYSIYKVSIITALIFLNISPLHEGKYGFFLYFLGKKMLADTIDNNEI